MAYIEEVDPFSLEKKIMPTGNTAHIVAISPCGNFFAAGTDHASIEVWRKDTSERIHLLEGHKRWVYALAFSPCGKFLYSGTSSCSDYITPEHAIKVWDMCTGECITTLSEPAGIKSTNSIAACENFFASASSDNSIKLWSTENFTCQKVLCGHTDWVLSVAISPCMKFIVSGSKDHTVKIWSTETGLCLRTLSGHTEQVNSVAISSKFEFIVSSSNDKTIRFWCPHTGESLRIVQGLDDRPCSYRKGSILTDMITSVAISPCDRFIISGSWDESVRIRSTKTLKCTQEFTPGDPQGTYWEIHSVAISKCGTFIVSGGHDIRIYGKW